MAILEIFGPVGMVIIILVLGVLIAIPASMVGITGGILFTPALILLFGLPPQLAVGTGLAGMLGSSLSSSISYIAQKRIDYKVAILYDVLDIPGAFLGVFILTYLATSSKNFMLGTIGMIIFLMGYLLLGKLGAKGMDEVPKYDLYKTHVNRQTVPFILISSFLSGIVSGMAGLGGGTVDTTTMVLIGMPPHFAGPTSEFIMDFANITALLTHGFLFNIFWLLAVPLFIGASIGGIIGSLVSRKTKPKVLIFIIVTFAWISAMTLMSYLFVSEIPILTIIFAGIIITIMVYYAYSRLKNRNKAETTDGSLIDGTGNRESTNDSTGNTDSTNGSIDDGTGNNIPPPS